MYTSVDLNDMITIQPHDLAQVRETVVKKLKAKVGTCTKDTGYIIDIISISPLTSYLMISRTSGGCIIPVRYKALTLLPRVGDTCEVNVSLCNTDFIFTVLQISPTCALHIIIPLEGKNKDDKIQLNSKVKVRITDTRYVKHQYQCIGEFF